MNRTAKHSAAAAALALLLPSLLLACNESPMVFGSSSGGSSGSNGGSTGSTAGGGSSSQGGSSPGGTTGAGGGFTISDAAAGTGGGPGSDAGYINDAPVCNLQNIKLEKVPPELLLVLDRSSSMNRIPVGAPVGSMATLWTDALGAVDEVVKSTQTAVQWGLKMFPVPTGCMVADGTEIPIAANNYDMVIGKAKMTGTNTTSGGNTGGTPTDTAMAKATAYLMSLPSKNPKYIVLATDGQPTCAAGVSADLNLAGPATINAIKAAGAAGFKTYVIGIAIEGSLVTLNEMADAGGVPRMDPANRFYPVANRADLTAALNVITGQVSNCIFPLDKAPPDKDAVAVKVDNERVPPSAMDGWSYTSAMNTAIQLNGSWCERVKTKAADVAIIFGCPNIPIP
jgi:hypothetical protein